MKYILLMQFSQSDWNAGNTSHWTPEEVEANMDYLRRFHQELAESGEFVLTEGLGGLENAKIVQAGENGVPAITDGPFPESKEVLAGFWIIDVDGPERAYQVAAKLSALPGPGGVPANVPIEVRPVMHSKGDPGH
jgi:hypothetical protein